MSNFERKYSPRYRHIICFGKTKSTKRKRSLGLTCFQDPKSSIPVVIYGRKLPHSAVNKIRQLATIVILNILIRARRKN